MSSRTGLRGHPWIRPGVVQQVQLDDTDAVVAGRCRQGGPQRLLGGGRRSRSGVGGRCQETGDDHQTDAQQQGYVW